MREKTGFRKDQLPALLFNVLFLIFFGIVFVVRKNYEFIFYIGIISVVIFFIYKTNNRAHYSNALSWALSFWAVLHMSGSAFFVEGVKLYDTILVPISEKYGIFRYDQFVHIIGMFSATVALFYIVRTILKPEYFKNNFTTTMVLIALGLGLGVGNEIVEFLVTVVIPENGVGGYVNTSLDHIANLFGVLSALIYIHSQHIGKENLS